MVTKRILANICWFLLIISIGANYFAVQVFSLEIAAITGCLIIFSNKTIIISKKDYRNLFLMFLFSLGIFFSRLFYTPELSMVINVLFLIKITFFFLFTYFYIVKYQIPHWTLYAVTFFVIPHFIVYIFGLVESINGQFPGLHGDPNYTSADYISSFLASLILIHRKDLGKKLKIIFLITLLISIFMVLISASRTALISCVFIFLVFSFIKFKLTINTFPQQIALLLLLVSIGGVLILNYQDSSIFGKIYNRLFESEGGASLMENERYVVWTLSYELIRDGGYFQGFGGDNFLTKIYRFGPHNSWLDIGIRMGSYTFYSYLILTVIGFFKIIKTILTKKRELGENSINLFLILYPIGIAIMLFSISVSFQYHYWFLMFLLFMFMINKFQINKRPYFTIK